MFLGRFVVKRELARAVLILNRLYHDPSISPEDPEVLPYEGFGKVFGEV